MSYITLSWVALAAFAVIGIFTAATRRDLMGWPVLAGLSGALVLLVTGLVQFAPVAGVELPGRFLWILLVALAVVVVLFERRALIPADGKFAWTAILGVLALGAAMVVWQQGEIPDGIWREIGVGIAVLAAREELVFRGVLPGLIDRFVTVSDERQYPYRFGPSAWGLALLYGLYEGIAVIGPDVRFFFLPFLYGVLAGLVLAVARAMTGTILAPLALHVGLAMVLLGLSF